MELSNNLLKEFAAITNDKEKPNESTTYGIVSVEGDQVYVTFDGAATPTPVDTLVDVQNGDRVMVRIKNHVATITGISTPAAKRISSLESYGEAVVTDVRSPESVNVETEYPIRNIDNSGAKTSFVVDDEYGYLEAVMLGGRVVYFYNGTNLLKSYVYGFNFDTENAYWTVTIRDHFDELTTDYNLHFSVWIFKLTTSIDTGKLVVDGEHNSRWIDDDQEVEEDKHTQYVYLGPETTGAYDPISNNEDYDYEEAPPQTVRAVDPKFEPLAYDCLKLEGDTFRGYGASTIYDDETETTSFVEREAYLTPIVKVTPFGAEFTVTAEPVEPDYEYDREAIDHPAYNTLKLNAGFTDIDDAVVFTKHVKQTGTWDGSDDIDYEREYFEDTYQLYKGREYRPVWQYEPGDDITIPTGQYFLYVQGKTGTRPNARQNLIAVVELGRSISKHVSSIEASGVIGAMIHSKDGVVYNNSDTEAARTFPASGKERIAVTSVGFTRQTGQVRIALQIAAGKTCTSSADKIVSYSTGVTSIINLNLKFT